MTKSSQRIEGSQAKGKMRQQSDAADAEQSILKSNAQEMEQIVQTKLSGVDLRVLEKELAALRVAMRQEPESPERDIAIGNVAAAEKATTRGEAATALQYLKTAGRWSLGIAEKIGTGVAVIALKAALGL